MQRPEPAVNKKMAGYVEVQVSEFRILSTSDNDKLPFTIRRPRSYEDLRLRYGYLDLRSPKSKYPLEIKKITRGKRSFDGRKFVEVETPILYKSTP